jgi:hypothetical protein
MTAEPTTEPTTEPKIVYLVTEGSYSDYNVTGVFEHEADAIAHCEHMGSQVDRRVEPFPLLTSEPPTHIQYVLIVHADTGNACRAGTTRTTDPFAPADSYVNMTGVDQIWCRCNRSAYRCISDVSFDDALRMGREKVAAQGRK